LGQWETTFLGDTGCEIYVGNSGNPYTEISVPDSEIAYSHSDTLRFLLFCQDEGDPKVSIPNGVEGIRLKAGGDRFISFPPGNPNGVCPLNRYYLFESLDPGVQPNLAFQVIVEDDVPPADFEGGDGVINLADLVCFISWTPIEQDTAGCLEVIDYYIVLRDTHPDSVGPGDSLAATADTFYWDSTAAVGNTGVNHYYAIQAVDEGGNKSAPSSAVGEFDRSLLNAK